MTNHELLRGHPFFGFLPKAQVKALSKIARRVTYPAGGMIFREGERADWLGILVSGSIDLFFTVEIEYRPELTRELRSGIIQPGEIFGLSAVIEPHVLTSSARAVGACEVVEIEAAGLLALCEADDRFAYGLIRQVAHSTMERLDEARLQLAEAFSQVVA